MKPAWKKVAERAWNGAFTPDEVAAVLPKALLRECDRAFVRMVEIALSPSDQGILFSEIPKEIAARVDGLRAQCPGSSFGANLIDATIFEIYHPTSGTPILQAAIETALRSTADCAYRGIEEYGLRHGGMATANALRTSLQSANELLDYEAIRRDLTASPGQRRAPSVPKKTGLNEGVPL
jgi:hypothetical protein